MIIKGGILIHPQGPCRADLLVHGETVAAILEPDAPVDPSEGVVDARGLWILPGGVDAHTHFGMPLGGGLRSLGWRESSEAALLGGTTTVVDFANPDRGEPLNLAVARWQDQANGQVLCDYGLHCTVVEASEARLAEIAPLVAAGVPTFKGFLAYKGRLMLEPEDMARLMTAVKAAGALLLVHAEDGQMNAVAQDVLLNTGRIGPRYHPLAHPEKSEVQAVEQVLNLALASGCPLEIVHMSLARSVELLCEARARHPEAAARLIGEVCLHHLLANEGLYESGHEAALAAVCSPPLRPAENGPLLRDALCRGELQLLSTDHCEFSLAQKAEAAAGGFHLIPNGCAGVGERLVFSHTHLVATGLLTPAAWVRAVATDPARLMGLQGRKGLLEPGCDADIVLFDPEVRYNWHPLGQSDPVGSLWTGLPVQGAVHDVWLRGRQVVQGGRLAMDQPGGIFLPRTL